MSGHPMVVEQRKHFAKICAVKDVSFCVEYGATCVLLGANGAGKTTTIAKLLGLIDPAAGNIRILGFGRRLSCVRSLVISQGV